MNKMLRNVKNKTFFLFLTTVPEFIVGMYLITMRRFDSGPLSLLGKIKSINRKLYML